MLPSDEPLTDLRAARQQFLTLVEDVRPDLHRYCARMTGSVTDGEDVVQDTLARAYFRLPELPSVPDLRPWLFRVAHNRAIDFMRRYERRMSEPIGVEDALADDARIAADDALARGEAVAAALTRFLELPPIPRSCVILKDVLGHTLEELADLLDLSLPAVKGALHRGRERLRVAGEAEPEDPIASPSPTIARYVELFNARDWDGVRAMLSDDVRLDVVSRARRRGRREAGQYVHNYSAADDWYMRPGWFGDREVIAVYRNPTATDPAYFIELTVCDGAVTRLRDFRYVPYIMVDATIAAPGRMGEHSRIEDDGRAGRER